MRNRSIHASSVVVIAFAGLAISAASAGVITQDQLPYTFADGYKLLSTVGAKTAIEFDLFHPVKNMGPQFKPIGSMKAEHQLYKGTHGAIADGPMSGTGGAWADYVKSLPNFVQLSPNWSFAFIQAVSAETNPGVQPWKAGPGEWFIDTGNVTNDPRYGQFNADTQEFDDYPDRPLNVNEVWKAEMSLALVNLTDQKVEFIGSFIWGFRINAGQVTVDGTLYGAPAAWGPVTDNLKNAFKKDWKDGNIDIPDFHTWTIVDVINGGPQGLVYIPAPGTIALLAGVLFAARRRRP
ncbi:MAG: hypothetical protein KF787_10180 [Phycisphaeraceae bacterium]|nr:hypothetical protein [Phycisphaerae bacterium]MBX3393001.1 hypothetical protein [Phycisphaeraceae bacterium]